jgi:hypothetical protein
VSFRPLAENEVVRLLNELCIGLGFCLPPDDNERLRADPPEDPDAFTNAVFVAEGMDPILSDGDLWRSVRGRVLDAFRREPFGSAEQRRKRSGRW